MEEDATVKAAPVTRLRRRLSVETDETKSPSAPSTPTKKRAARLAAKPQLELIDEHAVTDSPKRATRKSTSRDVAEPEEKAATPARQSTRTKSNTSLVSEADEKPPTPARRSTRIKSNTSLVSEVDEKPSTPAKRATRIKSNTSIVSETVQSVESPRAKRAVARRNSQVGSDTEAPVTPARTRLARKASTSSIDKDETLGVSETAVTPGRTRRTRKGSTSSIDTPTEAVQADKPSLITEVISEEPEGMLRKSTSNDTSNVNDNEDSLTRKSPRLMAKKGRKSTSEDTNETPRQQSDINEETVNSPKPTETPNKELNIAENSPQNDISMSSAKLINDLDTKLKKKMANKNKSLSDIEYSTDSKKRERTKSWTTLCASPKEESNFYSDNESTRKKLKKHGKIFIDKRLSSTEDTGSGDGPKQTSAIEDKDQNLNKSNRNRKSRNKSGNLESSVLEDTKEVDISNESNKENLLGVAPVVKDTSAAEILFESVPTADVKSMVFIEDSDSNNGVMEKEIKQINNEDQRVPVVLHQSEKEGEFREKENDNDPNNIFAINNINNKVTNDNDVEPMDIDETIPDNVSITKFSENVDNQDIPGEDQNNSETETKKSKKCRKSSQSVALETESVDKSKRKSTSSLSHSTSENNNIEDDEEQNVTMNENMKDKKSRKSSLVQEPDYNLTENINKSKRKSTLSNSISEDKKENTIVQDDNGVVEERLQNKSSRKSSLSIAHDGDDNLNANKSKRKSSLSNSIDNEKTNNESRSTLVLSQIKDYSTAENSASKSPQNTSELSKSINIDEANKEAPVNKNLTLNYLTSTPVQQKNLQKLAEMNTSVITPTIESKKSNDSTNSTRKKNVTMVSKSSDDENSSDEDSEEDLNEDEESSKEKSNLFDDEAEDAGEDYKSGDSQDEEEQEYERENEIMEKGETLTSEEDISNDSDYEKDSFIVDSDEEDNELLSGSGDDLNMSDNELTLSAKSKKKFNDRKLKEQKKASREMFEARHGLNKADQKTKNKPGNRNRLDSTLLKSDEDVMPPKKNKRMRLESTMESDGHAELDAEDSKSNKDITITSDKDEIGYKKKKSKRLSESVCHDNTMNEKEISICNQSTTEKVDPLLQIKTEPKTPIKDLEISRVHVTDDVEEVHVDEDMSILKSNETSDPLQSTMLQEENDSESDDDSISENEEIANNYDSVLINLNKENNKQIKSHNISLNLDKKAKKTKEPIVEELNLTSTKVSKKDNSFQAKKKSVKRVFKKLADSDESSDSKTDFDLQLLFSDDSNGSDDKKGNNISKTSRVEAKESIIPLKKSEAKTDIRRSIEQALPLDISEMKKNKKTGADKKTVTEDANEDEGTLNFFIDTKGDLSDKAMSGDDAENKSESDDAPVEMLYVSNKNKNDSILNKTPTSAKKKVSQSKETDTNVSIAETPASGKKNKSETPTQDTKTNESKKRISISQDNKLEELPKTPGSEKKSKKTSVSHEVNIEDVAKQEVLVTDEVSASTAKKRKRKSSANKTTDDMESEDTSMLNTSQKLNGSVVGNKKKKVKISTSIDQIEESLPTENPIVEQTDSKKTKKKKQFENKQLTVESEPYTRKSKKRKERDEEIETISKVFKENSFDKVHVPRLPPGVIDQLEEISGETRPKTIAGKAKAKIVSTSNFTVEETVKRKNKPSDFLEETVYLNEDESNAVVKKKSNMKKPKVLPFLPTVSTSDSGFTTNFQVNVISQKMEFVARNNEVPNFKNDYLNNKKIKKLRTYDLYKKQRNIKLTKY